TPISVSLAAIAMKRAWELSSSSGPQATTCAPLAQSEHEVEFTRQSPRQVRFPEPYPRPTQLAVPKSLPSHASVTCTSGHDPVPPGSMQVSRFPFPHVAAPQLIGKLGWHEPPRPVVPDAPVMPA